MPDETLELLVRSLADTKGIEETMAGFKRIEAQAEKMRYEAKLAEMAGKQAAQQATTEVQAMEQRSSERKIRLQAQAVERAAYEKKATDEVAASVSVLTKEQITNALASGEAEKATSKWTASKHQLRQAVHGLAYQFPVLGQLAMLAINPITLAVSGIAGAFAIWKQRVDGLTRSLGGVELPQLTDREIGKISATAEAYQKLADALDSTARAYHGAAASQDRAQKAQEAELEQAKKVLAAMRDSELAKLDARKGTMSEADYQRAKAGIEGGYSADLAGLEKWGERQAAQRKIQREDALGASAARKEREAEAIKVLSPEMDAWVTENLKRRATTADQGIAAADERLKKIAEMEGSGVGGRAWLYYKYGTFSGDRAREIEQEGINRLRPSSSAYQTWILGRAGRDALRERQQTLFSERDSEAREAFKLFLENPDQRLTGNASAWPGIMAGYETPTRYVLTQPESALSRQQRGLAQIARYRAGDFRSDEAIAAQQAAEAAAKAVPAVTNAINTVTSLLRDLEKRLKSVENSRAHNPPST